MDLRHTALATTAALAYCLLAVSPASAARPCKPIDLGHGDRARIATIRVSCSKGREVAAGYYGGLAQGDHWDGKAHGAIYYEVEGFRCFTGLGGTQMMCRSRNRWVLASSRPEDHPGSWGAPDL